MRYICALIPGQESARLYVQTAQELFRSYADSYLLSETVSPHITICQFETDENQKVKDFWSQMQGAAIHNLSPRLTGVSFQKGTGVLKEFCWAEISVARDPHLVQLHQWALKTLEELGLKSLNDSGDLYRPHITLARIRMPETVQRWPDGIFEHPEVYRLTLARGDDHGQYLSTVFESLQE